MTATIPQIEAYPKTIILRDGAQVVMRPLIEEDRAQLLDFFRRVPEQDRFHLKEDVTSPEVIEDWTSNIDTSRVIPIVALAGDDIVADATLHRCRTTSRCHIGEVRIVVDPAYREIGLGRRLIRELLDIAVDLDLQKVFFELVPHWEGPAIAAARSVGFREAAILKDWVRDYWGDHRDLIIMELPLIDYRQSCWY